MIDSFFAGPADRLRASVVGIADLSADLVRRRRGSMGGAGIALSEVGLFVTSAHVVTGTSVTVLLPDGSATSGVVVRRDAERDVALIYAAEARIPPVVIGDPRALRPGSLVFAIGHPFGLKDAVSVGVYHGVSPLPRGYAPEGMKTRSWVQADVRLAPGNSGGPLADASGRVIGVSTMIVSGLAVAVPITEVQHLLVGAA
jgi:serine protease Do